MQEIRSVNVLMLKFTHTAEQLKQLCEAAHSGDPTKVFEAEIIKYWREDDSEPMRQLTQPETGTIQFIPMGPICLDASGHHFYVIADVYDIIAPPSKLIIRNPDGSLCEEKNGINAGTRITAVLDTGSGYGYISDYGAPSGEAITLPAVDFLTFSTNPATPKLCLGAINPNTRLSAAAPSSSGSAHDDDDENAV